MRKLRSTGSHHSLAGSVWVDFYHYVPLTSFFSSSFSHHLSTLLPVFTESSLPHCHPICPATSALSNTQLDLLQSYFPSAAATSHIFNISHRMPSIRLSPYVLRAPVSRPIGASRTFCASVPRTIGKESQLRKSTSAVAC